MNALFRRLDVDRLQWRALVIASLKADFSAIRLPNQATGPRMVRTIGMSMLVYMIAGISPAFVAYVATDHLFAGTMMVTFVGFMVLSTLLLGDGTTVISPTDHHVLGFRPVTSRTYLAVRVSAILVRTVVIATAVALAPVGVFFVKGPGVQPFRALAALAAAYAVALAVTLAVVSLYGWLLRIAGPSRLSRWATYTQFGAQSVAWGGFFVTTQGMGQSALAGVSFSDHAGWLLYPGTWFGSYVAIGAGDARAPVLISALMSLALILGLVRLIGGKLSLGYAEDLARVAEGATGAARAATGGRWLGLLNSETRAVALLVRSHLRHDVKFRLGLVSLLPIMIMYMYLGGLPADPFVTPDPARERSGESMVIMMALLFIPPTLRRVLVTSQAWRASWVFHVTPADKVKLVMSSRNIIALFFLVPFLLIMAGLFTWSFGNALHALLHTLYIGMLSYAVLQWIIMFNPELPFSLPIEKEAQGTRMFGVMFGAVFAGMILYFVLTKLVYGSAIAMVLFAVAVAGAFWLMNVVTRRRAAARSMTWSG